MNIIEAIRKGKPKEASGLLKKNKNQNNLELRGRGWFDGFENNGNIMRPKNKFGGNNVDPFAPVKQKNKVLMDPPDLRKKGKKRVVNKRNNNLDIEKYKKKIGSMIKAFTMAMDKKYHDLAKDILKVMPQISKKKRVKVRAFSNKDVYKAWLKASGEYPSMEHIPMALKYPTTMSFILQSGVRPTLKSISESKGETRKILINKFIPNDDIENIVLGNFEEPFKFIMNHPNFKSKLENEERHKAYVYLAEARGAKKVLNLLKKIKPMRKKSNVKNNNSNLSNIENLENIENMNQNMINMIRRAQAPVRPLPKKKPQSREITNNNIENMFKNLNTSNSPKSRDVTNNNIKNMFKNLNSPKPKTPPKAPKRPIMRRKKTTPPPPSNYKNRQYKLIRPFMKKLNKKGGRNIKVLEQVASYVGFDLPEHKGAILPRILGGQGVVGHIPGHKAGVYGKRGIASRKWNLYTNDAGSQRVAFQGFNADEWLKNGWTLKNKDIKINMNKFGPMVDLYWTPHAPSLKKGMYLPKQFFDEIQKKRKFVVMRFEMYKNNIEYHMNALVYDVNRKILYRYDPGGDLQEFKGIDKQIEKYMQEKNLGSYVPPAQVCPMALQKKGTNYCHIWSVYFIDKLLDNPGESPSNVAKSILKNQNKIENYIKELERINNNESSKSK